MKKVILVLALILMGRMLYAGDTLFQNLPYDNSNDTATDLLLDMQGVIPADMVSAKVMKDTVILTLDDRAFCSGTFARDPKGQVHIYTAAHCCANYLFNQDGKMEVVTQGNRKVKVKAPTMESFADNGVDACRLEPESSGRTVSTRIGNAELDKDRNFFLVSPFPIYSQAERTQRVWVIGQTIEDPFSWAVSAVFAPGMSGSAIISPKGILIGFAVAGYLHVPHPVQVITLINDTGWIQE